jgi:hypothetical protein
MLRAVAPRCSLGSEPSGTPLSEQVWSRRARQCAINLALLARVQGFAWGRFFGVAKWALLAYAITAGMIEFAFVRDHLAGGPLVVLTLSLVVYAVHVPVLIAFTVARYADSESEPQPDAPSGVPA